MLATILLLAVHPSITIAQDGPGVVCIPADRPRGAVMIGLRVPVRITESAGVDIAPIGVTAILQRGDKEIASKSMTALQLAAGGLGRINGRSSKVVTLEHDFTFHNAADRSYDSILYVATFRPTDRVGAFNATLRGPIELVATLPMTCPKRRTD